MKKLLIASLLATSTLTNASDIVLSKGIKSKLRDNIERDLSALDNLKFKQPSPESLKTMGLESLTAQTASKWLEKRVNYVVDENAVSVLKLLIKKVIFVEREGVTFPNAHVVPYALDPVNKRPAVTPAVLPDIPALWPVIEDQPVVTDKKDSDEEKGFVVMSNIGAALYMGGKQQNQVYGMKISRGLLKSPLKAIAESPRVGIIQIGEGLFMEELTLNNKNPASIANSINRLATFFHEARHSDGNGSSLGFAHSNCPPGHDYAGAAACDENLNGPYTVGATMALEMLKGCEDSCTEREKEILKLVVLDSQNRIMKTTYKGTPATAWDDAPESL